MNDPNRSERGCETTEPTSQPPARGRTRRWRARQRVLRGTAVLPGFVTLLNGLAGLAAIHFATKEAFGTFSPAHLNNLWWGVWLIVLAMLFDMLDGRLARMTRRTSDFGGQLDSLCDAISFGVAPAMLMIRTVIPAMRGIGVLGQHWRLERLAWSVAAVYVACAVVRLARFNAENEPDESAHMDFRGLPSPGAAAALVSLVLLFERLTHVLPDWQQQPWFLIAASAVLQAMTLTVALLMVSRVRYIHVVNQYIRGRRPISYLVKLLLIALAVVLYPWVTLAVVPTIYVISGPLGLLWRIVRPRGRRRPAASGQTPPVAEQLDAER